MILYHVSDPAQLDVRPRVQMKHPERVYARYDDAASEAAQLQHQNDGHGFSVTTCGTPPEWSSEILHGDGTVQQLKTDKA